MWSCRQLYWYLMKATIKTERNYTSMWCADYKEFQNAVLNLKYAALIIEHLCLFVLVYLHRICIQWHNATFKFSALSLPSYLKWKIKKISHRNPFVHFHKNLCTHTITQHINSLRLLPKKFTERFVFLWEFIWEILWILKIFQTFPFAHTNKSHTRKLPPMKSRNAVHRW